MNSKAAMIITCRLGKAYDRQTGERLESLPSVTVVSIANEIVTAWNLSSRNSDAAVKAMDRLAEILQIYPDCDQDYIDEAFCSDVLESARDTSNSIEERLNHYTAYVSRLAVYVEEYYAKPSGDRMRLSEKSYPGLGLLAYDSLSFTQRVTAMGMAEAATALIMKSKERVFWLEDQEYWDPHFRQVLDACAAWVSVDHLAPGRVIYRDGSESYFDIVHGESMAKILIAAGPQPHTDNLSQSVTPFGLIEEIKSISEASPEYLEITTNAFYTLLEAMRMTPSITYKPISKEFDMQLIGEARDSARPTEERLQLYAKFVEYLADANAI